MIIASGQRLPAELLRRIYGTDWSDWTPLFAGGGTATFVSALGRWRRIGEKTVGFTVQWSIGTGGSGTSNFTWTLPTRPSRQRRWVFLGSHEGGTDRPGLYATTFTGGSGLVVDRVRSAGDANFQGQHLEAGVIYVFSGIYEEE